MGEDRQVSPKTHPAEKKDRRIIVNRWIIISPGPPKSGWLTNWLVYYCFRRRWLSKLKSDVSISPPLDRQTDRLMYEYTISLSFPRVIFDTFLLWADFSLFLFSPAPLLLLLQLRFGLRRFLPWLFQKVQTSDQSSGCTREMKNKRRNKKKEKESRRHRQDGKERGGIRKSYLFARETQRDVTDAKDRGNKCINIGGTILWYDWSISCAFTDAIDARKMETAACFKKREGNYFCYASRKL